MSGGTSESAGDERLGRLSFFSAGILSEQSSSDQIHTGTKRVASALGIYKSKTNACKR
jgi:hypothetical protein